MKLKFLPALKESILFILLIIINCIYSSCNTTYTVNLGPLANIMSPTMYMTAKDFNASYNNSDFMYFIFPKPASGNLYKLTGYYINGSVENPLSLTNTNPQMNIKSTNLRPSILSREKVADFISDLESEGFDFSSSDPPFKIYFHVSGRTDGTGKYVEITMRGKYDTAALESTADLKTNPCPPCKY